MLAFRAIPIKHVISSTIPLDFYLSIYESVPGTDNKTSHSILKIFEVTKSHKSPLFKVKFTIINVTI
jgi:hypothetical protein